MEDAATRVMERARVPKRYEHCDFQSYVTDLVDGKTWDHTAFAIAQECEPGPRKDLCATIPLGGKGIAVDGAVRSGEDASCGRLR